MNVNHKIRSLGVHTRFDSEPMAMECRNDLSAFAGERLPRIIDEVFSSRSRPGLIRRFDRVELDLGVIPRDEFPDGIEERLRKKLEEFLDAHSVLPETVSSAASLRQLPSGLAQEETIIYFLETGILPWYGSFSNAGDMVASVEKILETGAGHFINRLKDASGMKTIVKRLTRQFPEAIIEKILDAFAPGMGRSTSEIIRRLEACYADGTGAKVGKDPVSGADTVQEIKDQVWEHILLVTLEACGISSKRLKLELPQHSSPEARQEISRILGEFILHCFAVLADDIQVKGERDPHKAITDRSLANCPGKQTSGDPGPSPAKGKSFKESTEKDLENQAIEERVLKNSSILLYPGARASRPHVYCGRDARAPRLNYSGGVPEPDNGVWAKTGNANLRNEIIKDDANTGMTAQSRENFAGLGHEDFRDANPEPVSSAASPQQHPSGPAEEEAILHFLETGILPGYGSFSNTGGMAAFLGKCLETRAAHFIKRIKDAPDMKTMVKRLTRQFPEAIIEKILETVAPGRGRSTKAVIRQLDALYAAGTGGHFGAKAGKYPGSRADTVQEIKEFFWEHILLITLGGRGISSRLLKLELPQHSSPEARQEIARIWGEFILGCFDALADDIQVKRERESHQAIMDRPLGNCPGKQTPGDPRLSPAKGKPVRESTIYRQWIHSFLDCLGAMADEDASHMSACLAEDVLPVIGDIIFQTAVSMTEPEVFPAELSSMVAGQMIGGKKSSSPEHPGPEAQSGTPNAPGAGKTIFKTLETAGHSGLPLGQASVPREEDRSVPDPGREDRYDSMDTNPSIITGLKRWRELLGNPVVQKNIKSTFGMEEIWDMIQAIFHRKSREPDLETVRGRFKSDACAQSCKSLDNKRDDGWDPLSDKLSLILKSGPDPKDFLLRVLIGLVSSDPHQKHDPEEKPKSSAPESGKLENPPSEKYLKQVGGSRHTWNSSGSQRVTAVGTHPAAASREWGRGSEPVFVENAGMVLSGPYLPMLFRKLDLLDKKEFKSRYAAEKAVHILEYMVTGEQSAPEYRLVLNKLLCGMEPDRPIHQLFLLEKAEKDLTRELILSMIAHWKILGKTSVEGFRQSFLTREGRLEATEDAWTLVVAPKPFDMLLDRLPWTFSPIRFPWMDRVLHVRWR